MGGFIVAGGILLMLAAFSSGNTGLGIAIAVLTVPIAILAEAYKDYGSK